MEINKISDSKDIRLIDIDEFDETPGPNCMSFAFDIKGLTSSLRNFGLINFPVITRDGKGRPVIITGYRRIIALKALNSSPVPCIDITDSRISPFEQILFNLSDNMTTRRFNNIEKSMILNRLNVHVRRNELEERYVSLLNLSGRKEVDILLKMEELDTKTKEYIANGEISIKTIDMVLDLDRVSRSALLDWIINLRLNLNQQLNYIDYVIDISIKEGIGIPDVLSSAQYLEVFQDKGLNRPQKAKKILELLKARRYPFFYKTEKNFSKRISGLNLPGKVRIEHPPFFESEGYLLKVPFKNGRELKEKIRTLDNIKGLEDIEEPWKE